MKKIIIVLATLLAVAGCKKDDSHKFPADVQEVLNTIIGTWESTDTYNAETLTFTAYQEPTDIQSASSDWPAMTFHGTIQRDFRYIGDTWEHEDYYFLIRPDKKEINAYGITSNQTWALNQSKFYDYKIVDENTIRLHDQDLSLLNEKVYKRKQ
ncbi:MAG: hypothetical protein IKX38_06085 [Bacteroidales bacterium]|nr:hypothetical protein [Bacteroidales bacterium]